MQCIAAVHHTAAVYCTAVHHGRRFRQRRGERPAPRFRGVAPRAGPPRAHQSMPTQPYRPSLPAASPCPERSGRNADAHIKRDATRRVACHAPSSEAVVVAVTNARPPRLWHAGADLVRPDRMASPGVSTADGGSKCWSRSLASRTRSLVAARLRGGPATPSTGCEQSPALRLAPVAADPA